MFLFSFLRPFGRRWRPNTTTARTMPLFFFPLQYAGPPFRDVTSSMDGSPCPLFFSLAVDDGKSERHFFFMDGFSCWAIPRLGLLERLVFPNHTNREQDMLFAPRQKHFVYRIKLHQAYKKANSSENLREPKPHHTQTTQVEILSTSRGQVLAAMCKIAQWATMTCSQFTRFRNNQRRKITQSGTPNERGKRASEAIFWRDKGRPIPFSNQQRKKHHLWLAKGRRRVHPLMLGNG